MAQFNLDDYEPVDSRIKKFLSEHKDGRILTEIVSDEEVRVVMKARLFTGDIEVSTGFAKEIVGKGFVNQTSALENAETSAIGRALANYGYSGDKRASREEMEKVQRVTEDPATPYTKREDTKPQYIPSAPKVARCEECGTFGKWHKNTCSKFVGVPGNQIATKEPKTTQEELNELDLGGTL